MLFGSLELLLDLVRMVGIAAVVEEVSGERILVAEVIAALVANCRPTRSDAVIVDLVLISRSMFHAEAMNPLNWKLNGDILAAM